MWLEGKLSAKVPWWQYMQYVKKVELTFAGNCGLNNALKKSVKATEGPRSKKQRLISRELDACVLQQGPRIPPLVEDISLDSPESS